MILSNEPQNVWEIFTSNVMKSDIEVNTTAVAEVTF